MPVDRASSSQLLSGWSQETKCLASTSSFPLVSFLASLVAEPQGSCRDKSLFVVNTPQANRKQKCGEGQTEKIEK